MNEYGWFAEIDDDMAGGSRWQPRLQLDGHCPGMDIWFRTEEDCLDFIRTEVIGQGVWPEGKR